MHPIIFYLTPLIVLLRKMVHAGMHLGHRTRDWNPKMKPFIYTQKNNTHLIDLIKTSVYLKVVSNFLLTAASQGKTFLFVGTKQQAKKLVKEAASECSSSYVTEKWLGGMLTNWATVRLCINKLNELNKQASAEQTLKLPKKEQASLRKVQRKLEAYMGGVKAMEKLPDVVILIGQKDQLNAVKECRKLGIQTVTILDTNCDPSMTDLFVPANDDAVPCLKFLLSLFSVSIAKGQAVYNQQEQMQIKNKTEKQTSPLQTDEDVDPMSAMKKYKSWYTKQKQTLKNHYLTFNQMAILFDQSIDEDIQKQKPVETPPPGLLKPPVHKNHSTKKKIKKKA